MYANAAAQVRAAGEWATAADGGYGPDKGGVLDGAAARYGARDAGDATVAAGFWAGGPESDAGVEPSARSAM